MEPDDEAEWRELQAVIAERRHALRVERPYLAGEAIDRLILANIDSALIDWHAQHGHVLRP